MKMNKRESNIDIFLYLRNQSSKHTVQWNIFLAHLPSFGVFTAGTDFVYSTVKEIVENWKDTQIQQKIHINLHHQNQMNHGKSNIVVNNTKFNNPLLKNVELCTLVACSLVIHFVALLSNEYLKLDNDLRSYKLRCYQGLYLYIPFVKIVFPIIFLLSNQDLKDFIRKNLEGGENLRMLYKYPQPIISKFTQ